MEELKKEIYIRKYEAALKAAEDCRKREVSMINYSIIIYGVSIWSILTIDKTIFVPEMKVVALMFLSVLMGIIGLYIAKLNVVELKHLKMEKNVYYQVGIPLEDDKKDPYAGLNKMLTWLTYLLTIFFSFICSLFVVDFNISYQSSLLFSDWKNVYVIVFFVIFILYASQFYILIHSQDKKS